MYWWGWVLIVLSLFGILFYFGVFIAFGIYVRKNRVNPKVSVTVLDKELKYEDFVVDLNMMDEISKWKLASDNPNMFKFKFKLGFFKTAEYEFYKDDYVEFTSQDGRRKHIIVGLQHLNNDMQLIISSKQKQNGLLSLQYEKLNTRFDEELNKRLKHYKDMMPIFINKPKSK